MSKPLLALFVACGPLACGGPSVGEIVSQEVVMSLSAVGQTSDTPQVSRLYVSASSVLLEACAENVASLELGARGYDLAAEPPPREIVSTAVTELCAVRLEVEPVAGNEHDGVPEGASVHIEGTDAEGTPFTITGTDAARIELRSVDEAGFGAVPLIVGVNVGELLADLPLDEDSAAEAAASVVPQLLRATALYSDGDADGSLDEDEREPVALP